MTQTEQHSPVEDDVTESKRIDVRDGGNMILAQRTCDKIFIRNICT